VQDREEAKLGAEVLGIAPMVRSVSAVARNKIAYTWALFWRAIAAIASGTVNTTWK
jgi:hypothetical protein